METVIPSRSRSSRGRLHWLAFALAMVVASAMAAPGTAFARPTEQEVKAAMIFNITRFVEWPASAFRSPGAPLMVAIVGRDAVSDALGPMLRRKTVGGHPVELRRVKTAEEARKYHVLYLATSGSRKFEDILEELEGSSTLTISGIEHFADRGGHIGLVLDDQRVQVHVNPAAARESQLKISARLLSLARIVGPTP